MMLRAGLLLILICSSGCSTMQSQDISALQAAQLELHNNYMQQATVSVKCQSGCEVKYFDPSKKLPNIEMPRNGYDAYIETIKAVKEITPVGVAGYAATRAFKAIGEGFGDTNTTTITETTTQSTHNTQTETIKETTEITEINKGVE